MNIQESIKAILSVSEHQKNLKDFAHKSFQDWKQSDDYGNRFKDVLDKVWTDFDYYTIISETKIKITYRWGVPEGFDVYEYTGKMDNYDHIIIDILPEVRDSKLESLGI